MYLLQASLCLSGLTLVYALLLRNTTFHRLNRWVLLTILFASLAIPFLKIPGFGPVVQPILNGTPEPVQLITYQIFRQEPSEYPLSPDQAEGNGTIGNGTIWLIYGYWLVVTGLLIRLAGQLFSLGQLIRRGAKQHQEGYTLVSSTKVSTPFSFFRYIVVNPEDCEKGALAPILSHEKIHARQLHTIDRLLSEINCIFFWFNPLAWYHRYLLKGNLEYLTDRQVLRDGVPEREYQFSLLQTALPATRFSLANNFNHSLLKNRIRMINREASGWVAKGRYAFLIITAAGFLFVFNSTQARQTVRQLEAAVERDLIPATGAPSTLVEKLFPAPIAPVASTTPTAQSFITVKGIVKDSDSEEPLAGVKVQAKLARPKTVTDEKGRFTLQVPVTVKTLIFSARDYRSTEITIPNRIEMIVLLRSDFARKLEAILEKAPKGDFQPIPVRFAPSQFNYSNQLRRNLQLSPE